MNNIFQLIYIYIFRYNEYIFEEFKEYYIYNGYRDIYYY